MIWRKVDKYVPLAFLVLAVLVSLGVVHVTVQGVGAAVMFLYFLIWFIWNDLTRLEQKVWRRDE